MHHYAQFGAEAVPLSLWGGQGSRKLGQCEQTIWEVSDTLFIAPCVSLWMKDLGMNQNSAAEVWWGVARWEATSPHSLVWSPAWPAKSLCTIEGSDSDNIWSSNLWNGEQHDKPNEGIVGLQLNSWQWWWSNWKMYKWFGRRFMSNSSYAWGLFWKSPRHVSNKHVKETVIMYCFNRLKHGPAD